MAYPPLSDLPKEDPKGLTSDLTFLSGGGEMRYLIRAFDWSGTSIGPPDRWSPALRSTVSLMLANRFPLLLWWGPQYVSIYNDAYVPILGAKHPKALGQPVRDCWHEIWHILQPLIDAPFQGGAPTWIEDLMMEVNRHGYLEEGHWTVAYSPVPDETVPSGIGGILATVHEITEKVVGERRVTVLRDLAARATEPKMAEDACAVAAETLARHAKDIPFALLYVIDAEGKHARLAGRAGFTETGDANPPMIDLNTDGCDQGPWPLAIALRTESLYVLDGLRDEWNEVPRGPWSDAPQQAVIVPIRSNVAHRPAGVLVAGVSSRLKLDERYKDFYESVAGQLGTAIANARAYEEEKKRAEALAALDRAKTAFFSNVSHELRTPLTLLLGPLEELKAQYGRSASSLNVSEYQRVDLAHRNGLRLLKLVNTLLDFSRIEAGRAQAVYEATDLATFTSELASVFRSAIEKAGLSLIVNCPPLPEPVFVDRDMWEKIVLNLLSNAFKFTFAGEIEVALRLSGKQVELSIRDTGTGIPKDQLEKIFERFHRVAGSQGRTYEGTGIGLSLVQELARLHGGSITVESVYGKGSTFRVYVPRGKSHLPHQHIGTVRDKTSTTLGATPFVEEATRWVPEASEEWEVAPPTSASGVTISSSPTTRSRVLLADDNADMREYVSRLLKGRYDVMAVADGQAALEAVRDNPPDMILTDVMMPRLDGFGLLRALRDDPATKTIPVILLSARAGEEFRLEGLEQGADDYLIKPFSARELLTRVEMQVKMTRMRQDAQTALRESDARFRNLADTAPAILWVTEPDGSCSFISRGWYEFTGQTEQEGLGRDGFGWLDAVHPDDREQAGSIFLVANKARRPFSLDYRLRRHDGEYRWAVDAGRPRFGQHGEFLGYSGSVLDITERVQQEEALRASEEETKRARDYAEATLRTSPVPLLVLEQDLRVNTANEAFYQTFQVNPAETQGSLVYELGNGQWNIPKLRELLENILPQHMVFKDFEVTHAFESIGRRTMLLNGRRMVNEPDTPERIVLVIEDITERKRAEEALRQLNDELEQRVAGRTRDLVQSQNRLRTMATELNLAEQRERKRLATELHDHLQQSLVLGRLILGQGKRVGATVPACLDVMKKMDDIFTEALTYTRTLVADLSPPVLRDHGLLAGLKWLGEYMKKHEITVAVTVPEKDDLQLPEDQAVLLFQSVRELLINSSKHAGTRQADVRLDRHAEYLRIEVSDQGVGFDPAKVAATGTPSGGLSSKFGLFSIQERMRALGGSFDIRSAPGQGTMATLTLPLQSRAEHEVHVELPGTVSKVQSKHSASTKNAPIRILLVDDHPMMRQGLRSIVTAYDHFEVVGEAGDGAEAVELAQRLDPDVVVMDINMPKMDGIDATRQIKANQPTTVIIGLSVNQSANTEQKMKAAGAAAYLTKESAVNALSHAIEQAVSYKQHAAPRPVD